MSQAIEQEAEKCPAAQRLRTHPGVGSLNALAFVLIIGSAERFQCGKQIASYLGLVPSEESSGDRRRLGHISKQKKGDFSTGIWSARKAHRLIGIEPVQFCLRTIGFSGGWVGAVEQVVCGCFSI